jgi:hypothetical protein
MKELAKKISLAIVLSTSIFASSCTTTLSGEIKKESRDVKDFTGIELGVPGDVYLTQGTDFAFTVEADKDILEKLVTEVEGSTLKIRTEKGFNIGWIDEEIKIYITMPTVEKLSISGSGDIIAVTKIESESLLLSISGSGDISIDDLKVNDFSAKISGSGDISVSGRGKANGAEVKISGSGDVSLKDIEFANADVSITGSGDAFVIATENLTARVVGSGDITYGGKPLVDAKVTGSGQINSK